MKKIIAGNWKMFTTLADATVLTESIINGINDIDSEVIIFPPFVWLVPISDIIKKHPTRLKLGAQNMFSKESGAFTGEISPKMLKGLCNYVIIGHSERRYNFHETDTLVNDKLKNALAFGLTPILCIGEQKKTTNNESVTEREVISHLTKSLEGISAENITKIIIAYEPVWAISKPVGPIGVGDAATGEYVEIVINDLRKHLGKLYSEETAKNIRIIYGGSVKAANVKEYITRKGIDGVLVGTASLKPEEFIKICKS